MIKSHLELYLDGQWKTYHTYNQTVFDERRDGQIKSAMCYIVTQEKTRFKPMRKAKLVIQDETATKTFYYFAYFKSQKRGPNYWWHEVTLIDVAKRVQGQMIDGLRVVQDADNSITLYDTFKRLCDTTPLRLTTQSNLYNPTTDSTIVSLMQSIRSPEYAWSCRTLMWECLKEIGMDMGGYFPSVEFGDNGQYVLTFFPTDEISQTINDLDYISIAEGVDANQVCSEIDTDIANIIATNQETASIVFPGQNGWITPRTDDIQLTSDNCELLLPNTIEKIVKVYIKTSTFEVYDSIEHELISGDEALETDALDVTDNFVEYKRWGSLKKKGLLSLGLFSLELKKNNTCYWTEDSNKISILMSPSVDGWTPIRFLILTSILRNYGTGEEGSNIIYINGKELAISTVQIDPRSLQFRVEYVPQDASTKLRAVKQEKCNYEYVLPYNQRAEIVDAPSLGQELDKSVNQMGVNYIKTVNRYNALSDILPIGTAYVEGADTYILTVNEYEQTSHENITVTHTFSKNWSMLSEYLKQNKQYRNTYIPTDILVRNLHYQDFIEISETKKEFYEGFLGIVAQSYIVDVLDGGETNADTEINNMWLYKNASTTEGVVISCASFAVKKSIVFSGKMQNNLTAGKKVDPDNEYYCQDVLYTDDSGEIETTKIILGVGIYNISLNVNSLPETTAYDNKPDQTFASGLYTVRKSSAEHLNFTYQVHFVSDMPDIIIGHMLAENCPLIQDRTTELTYQLWGIKRNLPKTATVINSLFGEKIADVNSSNMSNYWTALSDSVNLKLSGKLSSEFIGWAITDSSGKLYLARNGKPNEDQILYFNYLHKYHEQD